MNPYEAIRELRKREKQLEKAFKDTLPRKIGAKAVNLVNRNFREGGFYDDGLHPWKRTIRQDMAKSKKEKKYTPLLSGRKHLSRSTKYEHEPYKAIILNPVEYAKIHNEGGSFTTHPKVTPKLRKMAWARYFEAAGITREMDKEEREKKAADASEEAKKWKGIAMTKKQKLDVDVNMPQRRFIGPSRELRDMTRQEVIKEITNILTK